MTSTMHRTLHIVPIILLIACGSPKAAVRAPLPDDPGRQLAHRGSDAVLWQHSSAEAYWIYRQAYEAATTRLLWNIVELGKEQPNGSLRRPMAVIVDIDETVLDNSPYQLHLVRSGQVYEQATWKAWTDSAVARPCPGALEFLHAARKAGCEVFYVTNRDVRERASTLKNLNDHGFPDADEAHLLLMEGNSDKTERRARIRATHEVVLLIGDQLRDFDERFKDRSVNDGRNMVDAMADSLSKYFVLLPNPMYGTYRDAIQGRGTEAEKLQRTEEWFQRNGY